MSTTGFITQFLKNTATSAASAVARCLLGFCLCLCLLLAHGQSAALATEITQLRVERADDGVHLSAQVRFDLPPVVEDALLKGIPVIFVVEADRSEERRVGKECRL